MEPYQLLPLQVRVDLGVMAVMGYTALSRSLELEPYHMFESVIFYSDELNIVAKLFAKW